MTPTSRQRFDVSERTADLPVVPASGERQELVRQQDSALVANSGVALNVDWVDSVRIHTSAVERRAATLTVRRTVKKDWQVAWLLRAITCMDLTTLSGDDTDERVRRLCAKAMRPVSESVKAGLGIE
jgi:deoxyribose-phosphate aldolase